MQSKNPDLDMLTGIIEEGKKKKLSGKKIAYLVMTKFVARKVMVEELLRASSEIERLKSKL